MSKKSLYLLVVLCTTTLMSLFTPVQADEQANSESSFNQSVSQRSTWGAIKALYRTEAQERTVQLRPNVESHGLIYGPTAYIQPGQTVTMVIQRGNSSSAFFVPCRAGTWTLKFRQTYMLGDAAFINPHWGSVSGCMCGASTPWNKWATWTAWQWSTSKIINAGSSNIAFKFDIIYPTVCKPCGTSTAEGPAIVELALSN